MKSYQDYMAVVEEIEGENRLVEVAYMQAIEQVVGLFERLVVQQTFQIPLNQDIGMEYVVAKAVRVDIEERVVVVVEVVAGMAFVEENIVVVADMQVVVVEALI